MPSIREIYRRRKTNRPAHRPIPATSPAPITEPTRPAAPGEAERMGFEAGYAGQAPACPAWFDFASFLKYEGAHEAGLEQLRNETQEEYAAWSELTRNTADDLDQNELDEIGYRYPTITE